MKLSRVRPQYVTWLLAVSLLLLAHAGQAQRVWRFKHLDVENGLPNNVVTSIVEDGSGFIWFGTQSGLARYDGQRVRIFRHRADDSTSLSGDFILALYTDRQGRIWVATDTHGVNRYDAYSGKWQHFLEPGEHLGVPANLSVHHIVEDADGYMWFGTFRHGIIRLDPGSGKFALLQADTANSASLSDNHINDLYRDAGGVIWAATESGLNRYRRKSGDFDVLLTGGHGSHGNILHLAGEADGRLWLAGNNGLMRFTAATAHLQVFPPITGQSTAEGRPVALISDQAGGVWLGTSGQGLVHPEASGAHTVIRAQAGWRHGLSDDAVRTLYMDAEQRLWVGSDLGVDMITSRARDFASFQLPPDPATGKKDSLVRAVLAREQNEVWLGVESGVVILSATGDVLQTLRSGVETGLPPGTINALAADARGRIWIAGDGGLASFGAGDHGVRPAPALFPGTVVSDNTRSRLLSLMVASNGAVWAGANGAGIAVLEPSSGNIRRLLPGPAEQGGLTDGEILAITEDHDGSVWIGTWRGLNHYDPQSGSMRRYVHDGADSASLSHNTVSSIWVDARDRVWVGTFGGGLNQYLRGRDRFSHFGTDEGLSDNGIYAIIGDHQGRLWISTNNGLTRFDPQRHEAVSFHVEDGLQGSQFRWGAVSHDPGGQLYFGGIHGFTRLDPQRIHVDREPPLPMLVELRVNEQVLRLESKTWQTTSGNGARPAARITLDYRHNLLAMDFAAPRATTGADLRFSYRLSGLHDDWVTTAAGQAAATYAQVPPGSYRFQLRVRGANTPWSAVVHPLDIRITPSPWRTGWAYAAYLLLGLTMLAMIAWERLRRLASERAAAKAIKASEERLSLALWGSRNQMWDWDAKRNIIHRAHGLPGFTLAAQEPGLGVDAILQSIHPQDQAACHEVMERIMRGEVDDFEVAYRRRNAQGDWVWVQDRARVSARDSDGAPLRITGTMQDISELKRNEAALKSLNRDLEQRARERSQQLQRAYEELAESEKLASLGTMVAGVAHEINTPVGIGVTAASHIRNIADEFESKVKSGALRRSELDAFRCAMRDGSDLVLRNLQRAAALVQSFKQVAVDQSSERRRMFDVGVALHDVLTSLGPQLSRQHVEVSVDCPRSLILDSFPGAFYQVISNLVSNALIHGFADRDDGKIDIVVVAHPDRVEVSFADHGVGMDEATRRRIFEPFFTSRLGQGGSGLGLHIVHNLVTQVLRGSIHCHSEPGAGARFEFTLLRDPDTPLQAPDPPGKE